MQKNLYLDTPDVHSLTSLELILSVLIIGIAVSLAIPIYSNCIQKTIVTEILTLFSSAKVEAVEYYAQYGRWPNNLNWKMADTSDTGNFRYEQGAISRDLKTTGQSLTIRPMMINSQAYVVAWNCGYALPPPGFTVQGPNRTNMPPMYLSYVCRL